MAFGIAACDVAHNQEITIEPSVAVQLHAERVDPDKALAEKVKKSLGIGEEPLAFGVEVTAHDGRVELWGTVDSTNQRKRFGLTAAGVVGVRALENHLAVDSGA